MNVGRVGLAGMVTEHILAELFLYYYSGFLDRGEGRGGFWKKHNTSLWGKSMRAKEYDIYVYIYM